MQNNMARREQREEVAAPRPQKGQGGGISYQEAIDYLFNVAPLFQNIGAGAYKEGLGNTRTLDEHFGHPHLAYKTIHVAGTNGKGSVSHTLAAILQSAGYRVGLYTSPHLVDFRERIRVNGEMIPEQRVIEFVEQERAFFEPLHPSFFELTTALAFQYFKERQVDIAVIEVGLGGRLDCTNIITPILSVITNISLEHTQFLGDTLAKIACEKAGIIKKGVPVVIGETKNNDTSSEQHPEIRQVFLDKAKEENAPITFADELPTYQLDVEPELKGFCQKKNTQTILTATNIISNYEYFNNSSDKVKRQITSEAICEGFAHVCELTGLMGRWQQIQDTPTVICDTGHNPGGLRYIAEQLRSMNGKLRIVLGMVSDKDVRASLSYFPKEATYYFTQASVKRAMPATEIAALGKEFGQQPSPSGENKGCFTTVTEAYQAALCDASPNDFIFVGGSSFVVADLLTFLQK